MASLIEDLFPSALVAEIDAQTLTLTTNSHIDNDLKEHFADLVYQCQFSNQAPFESVLIYPGTASWPHRSPESQMVKIQLELKPYLPEFDYIPIDLSQLDDTQILNFRSQFLALSASLLKYHAANKHVEFVRRHIPALLGKVAKADLRAIIEPTFLYLLETSNLTGHKILLSLV